MFAETFNSALKDLLGCVYKTCNGGYQKRCARLIHDFRCAESTLQDELAGNELARASFQAAVEALSAKAVKPPRRHDTMDDLLDTVERHIRDCLTHLQITSYGLADRAIVREVKEAQKRGDNWSKILTRSTGLRRRRTDNEQRTVMPISLRSNSAVPRDKKWPLLVASNAGHGCPSCGSSQVINFLSPSKNTSQASLSDMSLATTRESVMIEWTIHVVAFKDGLDGRIGEKTYTFRCDQDGQISDLLGIVTRRDSSEQLVNLSGHTNFYVASIGCHTYTRDGLKLELLSPDQSLRDIPKPAASSLPTVWLVHCKLPYIIIIIGAPKPNKEKDMPYLVNAYHNHLLREPLAGRSAGTYENPKEKKKRFITKASTLMWGDLPAREVVAHASDWFLLV